MGASARGASNIPHAGTWRIGSCASWPHLGEDSLRCLATQLLYTLLRQDLARILYVANCNGFRYNHCEYLSYLLIPGLLVESQ